MEKGLTKVQKEILTALKEGKTVFQIAQDRGVSLNSIYEVLHRLEARGLVVKQYRPSFVVR